jgi:hypothetical protein
LGSTQIPVGTNVIAEGYKAIDPETYESVYNDRWLKEYVTSLFKRQWGDNMKKFGGIQLPGGLTLNGKETFDEATADIQRLETEMQDRYELPVQFLVG